MPELLGPHRRAQAHAESQDPQDPVGTVGTPTGEEEGGHKERAGDTTRTRGRARGDPLRSPFDISALAQTIDIWAGSLASWDASRAIYPGA